MLAWLSGMKCRLHITQWMPLPLTISCSSKSRLVLPFLFLPFWYLLTWVAPDKFQKSSKTIVCVWVRFNTDSSQTTSQKPRTTDSQLFMDWDHSFHPWRCVAYLKKNLVTCLDFEMFPSHCSQRATYISKSNFVYISKPGPAMSTTTRLSMVFEIICCILYVKDFIPTIHISQKRKSKLLWKRRMTEENKTDCKHPTFCGHGLYILISSINVRRISPKNFVTCLDFEMFPSRCCQRSTFVSKSKFACILKTGLAMSTMPWLSTVFTRNSIYAITRICHGNSICLSVCLSVCHTSGSVKNGWS